MLNGNLCFAFRVLVSSFQSKILLVMGMHWGTKYDVKGVVYIFIL